MPIEAAMVATFAPSTSRLRHRARCSIGSSARASTRSSSRTSATSTTTERSVGQARQPHESMP